MLYNGVRKYLLEGDSLPEVEAGCGGGGGLLLHRRQVLPARQLGIGGRPECTSNKAHVVCFETHLQVLELILPLCEDWLLGKRLFSLKTLNTRGNQRRDPHGNFQEGRLIGNICKLRC